MKQTRKGFIRSLAGMVGLGSFGAFKVLGKEKAEHAFPFPLGIRGYNPNLPLNPPGRHIYQGMVGAYRCKEAQRDYNRAVSDLADQRDLNSLSSDMQKAIGKCSKNLTAEIDRELIEFISNNGLRKS